MSLIRFNPTPSDRMAALWLMLTFEDAVVLEYGPMGTTCFAERALKGMGLKVNRLFSTHLSEDDVIMGDVTRLEKALTAIDRDLQPKVIFVVPSAILTVIGADIAGVCHYMQSEVNAKLIAYEGGGFKGDYSTGLADVYTLLTKELASRESTPVPGTYNILGACAYAYKIQPDLQELEQLMDSAFGAKRLATLGLGDSTQDMKALGQASVNLVIRAEALPAAKWLKENFGTEYIYPAPYGYLGTLHFLEAVGTALGKEPDADVMEMLKGKINAAQNIPTSGKKMRVSIVGDYDVAVGIYGFLKSLGLKTEHLICNHSLGRIPQQTEDILFYPTERERITVLQGLHNQWVLADDVSLDICPADNARLCISAPAVNQVETEESSPLMGIRGADFILERQRRQ